MNDFRSIALALPAAAEQPHFGAPSFRVSEKIFAQLSDDEETGLVKLSPGRQEWAMATYPDCFEIEPQWGRYGWTRLRWRSLPADVVADLLAESWRLVAPRKKRALLPS